MGDIYILSNEVFIYQNTISIILLCYYDAPTSREESPKLSTNILNSQICDAATKAT